MYRSNRTKDIRQPSAQEPSQWSEAAASLPLRIGDSASGLLKESFELRTPRAVTGVLASINPNHTKSGPSSSSKGFEESFLVFSSSSRCAEYTSDQGEAFRSNEQGGTSGSTYGQITFDEFFAGPNKLEHEPDSLQDWSGIKGDKQRGSSVGPAEDDLRQIKESETWKRQDENREVKSENSDGAAVVALLSDPAFTVDDEPSSKLDSGADGAEGQSYQRPQTGGKTAKSVEILHPPGPLGLMPDFGAPWNLSHMLSATQNRIPERRQFLEPGLGEVQPWIDILDKYHCEVWGEDLPLVQEACKNLTAEIEKQTCLRDGLAIRRLTMVLQHLDNSKNG